jgi:hypothetical protein
VFNHLSTAKPSFHYCVRLDTFALWQILRTRPASRIKRPHLSAVSF